MNTAHSRTGPPEHRRPRTNTTNELKDIREHVQLSGRPQAYADVAASPDLGVLLSDEDEASPCTKLLLKDSPIGGLYTGEVNSGDDGDTTEEEFTPGSK